MDTAVLARGPLCLVPPTVTISADGATITAAAGLWAFDPGLGAVRIVAQWLADGKAIDAATELALGVDATLAGQSLCYAETAQQTLHETVTASDPVVVPLSKETPPEDTVPEEPTPEPETPKDPEPQEPAPEPETPKDPEPQEPGPEPDGLTVIHVDDGTFQLDADPDQPLVLTLEAPHIHAGTHTITPAMMADMKSGPICLVPPVIAVDDVLTQYSVMRTGLWIYDPALGVMTVTARWMRNGVAFQDQTEPTLAFSDTYRGAAIAFAEHAVQAGGERSQASAAITVPANYRPADMFSSGTQNQALDTYVGLSGETWVKAYASSSNSTVNQFGRLHGGASSGPTYVRGTPDRGTKHFAEAQVRAGSSTSGLGIMVGVCIQGNNGYFLAFDRTNGLRLRRYVNGAATTISAIEPPPPGFALEGETATLRVEVDGTQLRYAVNGAWRPGITDGTLTGGGVGLRAAGSGANGSSNEIISFNGGSL